MRSLKPCIVDHTNILCSRDESGGRTRDVLIIEARGVRSRERNAFFIPFRIDEGAGDLVRANLLPAYHWAPVLKNALASTIMACKTAHGTHSSVTPDRRRETVAFIANSIEEFDSEMGKLPEELRPAFDRNEVELFWETYPRHCMAVALFGGTERKEIVRVALQFYPWDTQNVDLPTAVGAIDQDPEGVAWAPYNVLVADSRMIGGIKVNYPEDLAQAIRDLAPTRVIGQTFAPIKAADDMALRTEDTWVGRFNAIFYPALERRTFTWKRKGTDRARQPVRVSSSTSGSRLTAAFRSSPPPATSN